MNITEAPKTGTFQMRINPEIKQQVESLYAKCGMTLTDAVNAFFQQSLNVGGLPFLMNQNSKEVIRQQAIALLLADINFIGIVQGIAIIPGISRSGSTLFSSLLCKLDREFAVKFVFLISIPTILGSFILELPDGIKAGVSGSEWGPVIVGVIVAFLSGLFAVKVMLKLVTNRKLKYFSYYLFALALAVIIYSLVS